MSVLLATCPKVASGYLGLDTHLMRRMSELKDFDQSEFLADVYYPELVGPQPLILSLHILTIVEYEDFLRLVR